MKEFEIIELFKKKVGSCPSGILGIGDDAAIFGLSKNKEWVTSTDMIVEGVDFEKTLSPEWIARKALAVNLSDMAAMAAIPKFYLLSLAIPKNKTQKWISKFASGIQKISKQFNLTCIGGDMSSSSQVMVSITLFGEVQKRQAILRSGAKHLDWIGVTGNLGGSIKGHHYKFQPRIEESLFIKKYGSPHSMIDISDGFFQDLQHITSSSKMGAKVDLDSLPISKILQKKRKDEKIKHALSDGEDFELIFTVSRRGKAEVEKRWKKKFPKTSLSWVGRMDKNLEGVDFFMNSKKVQFSINKKGYEHF